MESQKFAGETLVEQAAALFAVHPYPSIVAIERHLRPGYHAAAECMAELERRGIVSPVRENGLREYLGPVANGRKAFSEFAERIGAVTDPAGRWYENLQTYEQRMYCAQAKARWIPWGDMTEQERRAIRYKFLAEKREYERLSKQFASLGGVAA